jgi:hypothetical protein
MLANGNPLWKSSSDVSNSILGKWKSFVEIHFLMLPILYFAKWKSIVETHFSDCYQFCTCEMEILSFEEIQFWCFQNPLWKPISLIVTNSVLVKWKSLRKSSSDVTNSVLVDWKSFEEMLELVNEGQKSESHFKRKTPPLLGPTPPKKNFAL